MEKERCDESHILIENNRLAHNMRQVRRFCRENGMGQPDCDIDGGDEVIEFIKGLLPCQPEN